MPPEELTARPPASNKLKRSPSKLHTVQYGPAVDSLNDTEVAADGRHALDKRGFEMRPSWALGYLSIPPRRNINRPGAEWWNWLNQYKYQKDISDCRGQYVYVVENKLNREHAVSLKPLFGLLDGSGRTN